MLDQKHINIIVRTIMPYLYRIQAVHDSYREYQMQRPKALLETDYRDTDGIHWIRTGGQTMEKKSNEKLN